MKEKNNKAKISSAIIEVGEFRFDRTTGTLSSAKGEQKLEPQVSAFFALLVSHAGDTVGRDMIGAVIGPNRSVSDDAIRVMVKKLRDALEDDARNPRYIRTLPLKGYVLIAPVSTLAGKPTPPHKRKLIFSAVMAMIMASAIYYLLPDSGPGEDNGSSTRIQLLTSMPGSEVSPDYTPVSDRLVFSHRANKEDYLQLHVKDLSDQRVQRLTWDAANYASAHWSPNGEKLIYSRSTESSLEHFLANYDPERGIVDPQPLPYETAQGKYLLGWSRDAQAIYLKDSLQPKSPQGIWRLDLASGSLRPITAPSVTGVGDFFVAESPDGASLAVLRGVEGGKRELLVLDINTGALLHTRILGQPADRLAWHPNGSSIVLSSFGGNLFEYQLSEDRFFDRPNPDPRINDVFFHCGDGCFYLRRHNGNFLDLEEQPDPFSDQPLMSSTRFDLAGAQDFPQYAEAGKTLFYFSLEEDALSLYRQRQTGGPEVLLRLPRDTQVAALQANPQGTLLTGIIGQRLFLYSIKDAAISYLSSAIELVSAPTWTPDGQSLIFSKREKGESVIYQYRLETGAMQILQKGYTAMRLLADGISVAIDDQNRAWLLVDAPGEEAEEKQGKTKHIATVSSAQPNRWQVKGEWFYFTEHEGNDAFIHRASLKDGHRERRMLARNRFRLNFDMHPKEERVAVVKSLLAESDLIRLTLTK